MRVHVERYGLGLDSTLGRLYVPGQDACFTLEDETRDEKVPGETAIPEGTYPVELREVGGFHARYSDRFPEIHKGMLWIRSVPGFEHILIHVGNGEDDTAGCILVGETPMVDDTGEFSILSSAHAYRRIYVPVADALLAGEDVTLKVDRR